jgi:hypothetical protein
LLRILGYTLLALLILPVLAPIAMAGHPDRCSGCHYELYFDPTTGDKKGDLVTDVEGLRVWSHRIYTMEAWYQCEVCHSGIAGSIAGTVHGNIGCACHAVIHAPKFDANVEPWYAWVAVRLIAIPTTDLDQLSTYLRATVERAVAGKTTLPAYRPIAGAKVEDLAMVLLRLPADTPTNYPRIEGGSLVGYLTLKEYFNLTDGLDDGDYGTMSYGVEVQLLTWKYGNATPDILALGTRTVPPPLVDLSREAWLACYNCHFVTAEPGAAGALRFVEGFWLTGIPEVALTLPAHGITREDIVGALRSDVTMIALSKTALSTIWILADILATAISIALVRISRRRG